MKHSKNTLKIDGNEDFKEFIAEVIMWAIKKEIKILKQYSEEDRNTVLNLDFLERVALTFIRGKNQIVIAETDSDFVKIVIMAINEELKNVVVSCNITDTTLN